MNNESAKTLNPNRKFKSKIFLFVILFILAMLAFCYYMHVLPKHDEKGIEEIKQAEEIRKNTLKKCIQDTKKIYKNEIEDFCKVNGLSSKATTCTLPSNILDKIDKEHHKAISQCVKLYGKNPK